MRPQRQTAVQGLTLRKFLKRRKNVSRHSSEGRTSFCDATMSKEAGGSACMASGISYGLATRVMCGRERASRLWGPKRPISKPSVRAIKLT